MKYSLAIVSTLLGAALAQGVTSSIGPSAPAPSGCATTFSGSFEITAANAAARAVSFEKRAACGGEGILVLNLTGGTLLDAQGRTGYIASNYQFQFDKPAQAGTIYNTGFSICPGNILALGSNTTFYSCQSGDFWNLYNINWAAQCTPVNIVALPCGSDAAVSQTTNVVGTSLVQTTVVTVLSDGQPQVHTTQVPIPICQINDGQVQAKTTPCASITVAPSPSVTAVPVSQYGDGQIQVTPPGSASATAPVATTAPAVVTTAPTLVTSVNPGGPIVNATTSALILNTTAVGTSVLVTAVGSTPAVSTPVATAAPSATIQASGSSHATSSALALLAGLMVALVWL